MFSNDSSSENGTMTSKFSTSEFVHYGPLALVVVVGRIEDDTGTMTSKLSTSTFVIWDPFSIVRGGVELGMKVALLAQHSIHMS